MTSVIMHEASRSNPPVRPAILAVQDRRARGRQFDLCDAFGRSPGPGKPGGGLRGAGNLGQTDENDSVLAAVGCGH